MAKMRGARGAALNAGTVFSTLKLDNEEFLKPLAQANVALQQFAQKFFYVQGAMDKAAMKLAVVGTAGLAFSGVLIKMAMDLEQTRVAFTSLLGSASAATAMLNELKAFAVATPFELTGLQDSTKRLLAFGFTAKEIIPILTDIGDATSALGLGQEGINRIILALGQMQAKAKVSGNEMRQLTEAGIPGWRYLAEAMGKSTGEVMKMSEKGLLPAGAAIQALREGIQRDFGGMMAEQAKTAAGQLSNLIDKAKILGAELGTTLLPAFKQGVGLLQNAVEWLGNLSDGTKLAIVNTVAYGGALALLTAGLLSVASNALSVISYYRAMIAVRAANLDNVLNEIAANMANAQSERTVAAAKYNAAAASLDEAWALEAEMVATNQATEANALFIASEKQKAVAAMNSAGAQEMAAKRNIAALNAQKAAIGSMNMTLAAVAVAVGVVLLAWHGYNKAQTADRDMMAGKVKLLEAEKKNREEMAKTLEDLGAEYERLTGKTKRTESETMRLVDTKEKIRRKIGEIGSELGQQAKAWDGTKKSIGVAVDAARNFEKVNYSIALAQAALGAEEARLHLERVKRWKEWNIFWTGVGATLHQTPNLVRDSMEWFTSFGQGQVAPWDPKNTAAQEITGAVEDERKNQLDAIKTSEISLKAAREALSRLQGMTPEEFANSEKTRPKIDLPETATDPAKKRKPEEIFRAYVAVAEELLKTEQAIEDTLRLQGKVAEADKQHVNVLKAENELRVRINAGVTKWAKDTKVGAEARQKLAELDKQSADTARDRLDREQKIVEARAEATRMLEDDLAAAKDAAALAVKLYGAGSSEAISAGTNARNAFSALQQQRLGDIPSLLGAGFMAGAFTNLDGALRAVREIRAAWAATTTDSMELLDINRESDEVLQSLTDKVMQKYELQQQDLNTTQQQLLAIKDVATTEEGRQTVAAAILKLTEDKKKAEEDAAKAAKDIADAQQKVVDLLKEQRALALELAEVDAKGDTGKIIVFREQAVKIAERELGTVLAGENASMTGVQRAEYNVRKEAAWLAFEKAKQELKNAVAEWVKEGIEESIKRLTPPNPLGVNLPVVFNGRDFAEKEQPPMGGEPEPYEPKVITPEDFRDFGKFMWNFSRDKGDIQKYLEGIGAEWSQTAISGLISENKSLQLNPTTGLPNFIHNLFPKLNNMNAEQAKALKTRISGGMGAMASIYSLSQAGGPLEGAMAGMGLASSLGQLVGGAAGAAIGGPVGIGLGLLAGALFGSSNARKAAEEQAQRQREQQLEQLRRINNALLPVSDYFRRGLFGAIPGSVAFGGGMNVEYAWSVQSRAGMQ